MHRRRHAPCEKAPVSNVMPREEFWVNGDCLNQKPLVLVVDDDPDMQALIIGALRRTGMACVGASSVEEALTALHAQKITLTVLDWGLDRSGVEVLTVARELYPSMPVVVISGMPLEVRTDAVVNKADAFLSKPFSETVLTGQVMQLIERTRQAPAIRLPQRPEDVLSLQEVQSIYIRHVVQLLGGNRSRGAEVLGIHRHTVSSAINAQDATAGPTEN
jgi:DNA-binding response OmpR family regulator